MAITWEMRTDLSCTSSAHTVKRSLSYRCRPKARTTRTPVRLSWSMALSLPSAASASAKSFCTQWKNQKASAKMGGTSTREMSVSFTWMRAISASARITMITVRNTSITWEARKRRTVSTSVVQRWIKSPVSAFTW